MSNSSMVSYIKLSPYCNSPRKHKIDTLSIHCIVGQLSVESIGQIFQSKPSPCSANYAIGFDGRVGMYVEECNRSWCTSSPENDNRAITIEMACDKTHPYVVNQTAYKSLINLLVDICKRNDIKELLWKADKSLIGQVDKQNMSVHRWFRNKSCPGDYLYNKHYEIAAEVNALLNPIAPIPVESWFRVRKSWTDVSSQVGAFHDLDKAIKCAIASNCHVYDESGNVVYTTDAVNKPEPVKPVVDIDDLARRVIKGEFGNGQERKAKLGSLYEAVRKRVNEMLRRK